VSSSFIKPGLTPHQKKDKLQKIGVHPFRGKGPHTLWVGLQATHGNITFR